MPDVWARSLLAGQDEKENDADGPQEEDGSAVMMEVTDAAESKKAHKLAKREKREKRKAANRLRGKLSLSLSMWPPVSS